MTGAVVAAIVATQMNEEYEKRRKSVIGKDQIIIESKHTYVDTKKIIADHINNLFYDDEDRNIYRERGNDYINFENAAYTFIAVGFLFVIAFIIHDTFADWRTPFYYSFKEGVGITALISLIYGYKTNYYYESSDFIVEEVDDDVLVQIKVYDSSGRRNYNELTIEKLIRKLEK